MAGEIPIENIRNYWAKLINVEEDKNAFTKDLINEIEKLHSAHQQELLDHEREKKYNRDGQKQMAQLEKELRDLRVAVNRSPFVLVLIDADGMIFEDRLLKKGEAGGKEAAGNLWTAVREYVHQNVNLEGIVSEFKVVARVYANKRGLADVCTRAGIIPSPQILEDFARGFTGNKQLFDFVDVGSGKDRADEKISELFRMNLDNLHCRHIILGCSHDNGYARLLEEVSQHPNINQITLLEGVPFERELLPATVMFATERFPNLFRTTKINTYNQYPLQAHSQMLSTQHLHHVQPQYMQHPIAPTTSNGTLPSDAHHNGLPPDHSANGFSSPYQESNARPASIVATSPTPTMNWAATASSVPPSQPLASPPSTPQPAALVVPRNKYGQRIDNLTIFDTMEVKRIQKMKMCNTHFLRTDCAFGDECSHTHAYKPTKNELEILRQVARSIPCKYGTECDDPKCIYGHRCPHSQEGIKTCKFGANCRFDVDMHGLDTKVVRTTRIS